RAICSHDFLRYNHRVQRLGRVASQGAQIESFENVQHLQRGNTLTVWRKLEDLVTAIVYRHRIDPCRGMLLEIRFPQEPAIGTHKCCDFVRCLDFVESVATFLSNQAMRSRHIWVRE